MKPPNRSAAGLPPAIAAALAHYRPGMRGFGAKATAKLFGVNYTTLIRWSKWSQKHSAAVSQPRGHRPRKLSAEEEATIQAALDENPTATNRQLASLVRNKIKPRTVSDVLRRANPPFTMKRIVDRDPDELTAEWRREAQHFREAVRRLPMHRRVYADETPVYANEAPTRGRARKGQKAAQARRKYGKKYTLHVFARQSGVVDWQLRDVNANDQEVRRAALRALKKINKGDSLLWDRLGGGGLGRNPTRQHFNQSVLRAFKRRGVRVIFLPHKGKHFNPVELLFNDLKSHAIRPQRHIDGTPLSKRELNSLIRNYMQTRAPTVLARFFSARANGRQLMREGVLRY